MSEEKAYLKHDIGSTKLLVWFGGRDEPFISDKMAHATRCDVLSIRNMRGDWYIEGIKGIEGGVEGAIAWLAKRLKDKPYAKIYFAGQSSGGFMALKMAHHFKPHAACVFNPTTQNWPVGVDAASPINRNRKYKITNLNDLYTKEPRDFPIWLNVGRSERDHSDKWRCGDQIHASILKDMDNVTYIQHPYDTHVLTVALLRKEKLYSFVASWVNFHN